MRSCLLQMLSDLSVPWEARRMQWTPLNGEEERAKPLWRANLSLCQDVSLNDGGSKGPSASVCLHVRTLARREIVDTVCQVKGEDAARTVHERIMNGSTDEDVDEHQHIATSINTASVVPLVPAPAGRLFDARWRDAFSTPWSRKEHTTVLEARLAMVADQNTPPQSQCSRCLRLHPDDRGER